MQKWFFSLYHIIYVYFNILKSSVTSKIKTQNEQNIYSITILHPAVNLYKIIAIIAFVNSAISQKKLKHNKRVWKRLIRKMLGSFLMFIYPDFEILISCSTWKLPPIQTDITPPQRKSIYQIGFTFSKRIWLKIYFPGSVSGLRVTQTALRREIFI